MRTGDLSGNAPDVDIKTISRQDNVTGAVIHTMMIMFKLNQECLRKCNTKYRTEL